MNDLRSFALTLACAVFGAGHASGATSIPDVHAYGDLSLEQLMNETVTSVSKREQKLYDVASAITVLNHDEIERSGATSVTDALRLVPGMNVGSFYSSVPAVSARGFNGVFANKLLVLVDGRAVYSPVYSGVIWYLQNPMLEDLDRIEVIKGPGAAIWGANAVNGVINMVSASARDTQGLLTYGGGGDVHRALAGVRFGGRSGENTYYRVFASYKLEDEFKTITGQPDGHDWRVRHGGFRVDHYPHPDALLTWQAEVTAVDLDDYVSNAENFNTLARWSRDLPEESSVEIQAYYDRTSSREVTLVHTITDTIDVSAQHTFTWGDRNQVVWGGGYRFVRSSFDQQNPFYIVLDDAVQEHLFGGFVQNELTLVPDRLSVTAGIKVEHNDFTGFEFHPSLRGVFKPAKNQTIWAAVSRAVRTPNQNEGENALGIVAGAPFFESGGFYVPMVVGNENLKSEVVWAYEMGYRIQPADNVSVDAAVFYNQHDNQIGFGDLDRLVMGAPVGVAEFPWRNNVSGHSYGGEMSVTVSPSEAWRLTGSYSVVVTKLDGPAISGADAVEQSAPRNQATLRAAYDFSPHIGIDGQLRYVDSFAGVPSYITADVRVSYHPTERLELSVVGQNLLDDEHLEQPVNPLAAPSLVPRGFYGKVTWSF